MGTTFLLSTIGATGTLAVGLFVQAPALTLLGFGGWTTLWLLARRLPGEAARFGCGPVCIQGMPSSRGQIQTYWIAVLWIPILPVRMAVQTVAKRPDRRSGPKGRPVGLRSRLGEGVKRVAWVAGSIGLPWLAGLAYVGLMSGYALLDCWWFEQVAVTAPLPWLALSTAGALVCKAGLIYSGIRIHAAIYRA